MKIFDLGVEPDSGGYSNLHRTEMQIRQTFFQWKREYFQIDLVFVFEACVMVGAVFEVYPR